MAKSTGWQSSASLSLLAFLVTGCGTEEAASIQAQAKTGSTGQPAEVRSDRAAQANQHGGRLRAVARWLRHDPACGYDRMELLVLDGNRQVARELYCSAYQRGEASLISDNHGDDYVLLRYSEGRGTHATSDYLKIYRFIEGELDERAILEVSRPYGIGTDQVYNYRTETPEGGGLVLIGQWFIEGPLFRRDPRLPARDRTIVAIDTRPDVTLSY